MDFVHLHTHSDYSCLQSLASTQRLLEKCQTYKMPGLALTDLGNLYGAMEFFELASRTQSINPIIGCEFYVQSEHYKESADTMFYSRDAKHKFRRQNRELNMPYGVFKVILLAETDEGYKNLIRLSTLSFTTVIGKVPTLRLETLFQYRSGLICLSGGMGSELFNRLATGNDMAAESLAQQFMQVWGPEHYFLEIQDHQHELYTLVTEKTVALSQKFQISLVATNETFYIESEDYYSHEIMLCISGNHVITEKRGFNNGERPHLIGTGYHFKSAAELYASFKAYPEALQNTLRINERCRVNIRNKIFHMPKFPVPEEQNVKDFLRTLVSKRLNILFAGKEFPELYWDRIENELDVINSRGFAEYFLIVSDLIDAAKDKGILVGPGRGSVVGSLVAYALGITDVDPMQYNLLFERFLTKGRVSMPDIDIDFQDDRRDEVIAYLRGRYGEQNSCQIVTYAKLKARAVFKDVCRVFNIDFQVANRLSGLIGHRPIPESSDEEAETITKLRATYGHVAEFKQAILASEQLKQVYLHSLKLENLTRQTGIHAAGVVIADHELAHYIPIARNDEGIAISQYDGRYLETHCGLLKMDILGLRTLTLIKDATEQIKANENITLNWRDFPFGDKKTFSFFTNGMTMGIFQFESEGMTRYLRELKPSDLEELIAMNALYRPGPMAWIPVYIAKKHNLKPSFQNTEDKERYSKLEKLCNRFNLLREILESTRFIPIYQEQIMQICRVFAGFSLAGADNIRKAMGKKDKQLIASLREKFINGAIKLTHKAEDAVFLYDEIIQAFAGYGFNKSHAASYALLAYRVAYIKANYTAYFMAAFLTSEITSLREAKMRRIFQECTLNETTLIPPDINTASVYFKNHNGTISFAFNGIKGVSLHAAQAIVREREQGAFLSLSDFLRRMNTVVTKMQDEHARLVVNKQVVEALIKAQCFDSLYGASQDALPGVDLVKTSPPQQTDLTQLGFVRADIILKLYAPIQNIIDAESRLYKGGQQSLFDVPIQGTNTAASTQMPTRDSVDPFALEKQTLKVLKLTHSNKQSLKILEKEALGFNFREDLTLKYTKVFKELTNFDVNFPELWKEGSSFSLAAILEEIGIRFTKKNNEEMAILKLNTGGKVLEVVCFPETWRRIKTARNHEAKNPNLEPHTPTKTKEVDALVLDRPVKVTGFFKKGYGRGELYSLVLKELVPLSQHDYKHVKVEKKSAPQGQKLVIKLKGALANKRLIEIRHALENAPKGHQKIYLSITERGQERTIFLGEHLQVNLTESLMQKLNNIEIVKAVVLV